ncbi:MAG: adenosylcobinamide-GDP ribazoletransferase [Ferrimicrobium sp.]|uniref:Adenosylcobinamide-GDP ribazoletransferase n=1 Tax=Ferrimicrobium acidiphilum TaxID=121039 RepID=A0ABV3Y456_9ACTN|nr:adenosylcobinamide-GDP ribazoletransferase [Ferrimicrobium sp.]MCL5973123.1 adenosylcobinamide-GDP ribazoletransferase [Actinomycetota bacterium]
MQRLFNGVRGAVAFMTLLPLGGVLNAASLVVLPLTGLIVGGAVALGFWIGDRSGSSLVGAVLALFVDAAITRGLHYDAVADTADGLAGFVGRQRRIAIMDEPTVGAFAVVSVVVVVLARVSAWSSLGFPVFLVGFFVLGRALMALSMLCFPLAKESSLTKIFANERRRWLIWVLVLEAVAIGVATVAFSSLWVLIPIFVGLLGGSGILGFAIHRLGGITGDVVGAVGLVGESTMLMVAAILRIHG